MNKTPLLRNPLARWTLLAIVAMVLTPLAAAAVPTLYSFESGSAVVRGTLEGSSTSIFDPAGAVDVDLTGTNAIVDLDAYSLDSLEIVADDFSVGLDPSLTGLESVSVSGATLQSLAPSTLAFFTPTVAQFALQSQISGTVEGTLPGGLSTGPTPFVSIPGSGSTTGILTISGDEITLQITGVTVASFPQIHNPGGANVELKADFTFVGKAKPSSPIPEPSAALVFGVGMAVAGSVLRRR